MRFIEQVVASSKAGGQWVSLWHPKREGDMRTLKGPAIFLAQFMADEEPFNSIDAMAQWASQLGFVGRKAYW
ncbi:MAG: hypothetical protein CM15mP120_10730 [Pseudomonadota bacterium]|nr:MAG: hypothetical protein CM15mP120_10730 [Pseudomonadota bacterium]